MGVGLVGPGLEVMFVVLEAEFWEVVEGLLVCLEG